MGTDIHAIFQKLDKGAEPPKWVEVDSTWEQDRHYTLFAALANVRNGYGQRGDGGTAIPPIAYPRGLPEDMTIGSYDEYSFGDHSQSWLSSEEMLEWYDNGINVQVEWNENFKEELKYFFDEVRRLKEEHGEVRLVFGFDS